MTPDITDQDEREAIDWAQHILANADAADIDEFTMIERDVLRALLQRATRAHD